MYYNIAETTFQRNITEAPFQQKHIKSKLNILIVEKKRLEVSYIINIYIIYIYIVIIIYIIHIYIIIMIINSRRKRGVSSASSTKTTRGI